eukprot:191946_1
MCNQYFHSKKKVQLEKTKDWINTNKICDVLLDAGRIRLDTILVLFPNIEELNMQESIWDDSIFDFVQCNEQKLNQIWCVPYINLKTHNQCIAAELIENECMAQTLRKKSVFIFKKCTEDQAEFVIVGVWKCNEEEFVRYLLRE